MPHINGNCKIVVANEPIRLVNVSTPIDRKDFYAASDNTGNIHIGGEYISSLSDDGKGDVLEPSSVFTIENKDLMDYWIVGANVGDYLQW